MAARGLLWWLALLSGMLGAAELPYVNFENHPIRALDQSPDGRWLAAAHTADQRVQLFELAAGMVLPAGHVVVGFDPVAVRFRSATELWVVNHVSDSISIIDLPSRRVVRTLQTADEPFDLVFAQGRAFVSCSQANQVLVFQLDDLDRPPVVIEVAGEDPRAMALSADGTTVYVGIFESGNASTILGGGLADDILSLPNVVGDPRGPYGGQNPPPNDGQNFRPALHPAATPPRVGLIVRKNSTGRWMDDNSGDWTDLVSGPLASASGRIPGWDLLDHDVMAIDTQSLSVRYVRGLMNTVMALAVNPQNGELAVIGTEALNEIRFEPNLNGRFLRVNLARVAADAAAATSIADLNPHLNYVEARISPEQRQLSIGDPRGITWEPGGARAWIAAMGSNNLIAVDADGQRLGAPIAVGEGPVAVQYDALRTRLYVWNHFEASLSVVDPQTRTEIERIAVFNPLPAAIRVGRPLLYDTHRTSGLGQASCASCHVDARTDRLAWDLGNPSLPPQVFNQNCQTVLGTQPCQDHHAMKGPMTTQTLQDIIGHEPFHWRGDRDDIESFNPAFHELLGRDSELNAADMAAFKAFLASIHFPPSPFRQLDNRLPTALPLDGHYTSGRFAPRGQPLGVGDAENGLRLFTTGFLDPPFQCASCHTLPTGMAVNGPLFLAIAGVPVGGVVMPPGPTGNNHLGIVSVDGSTNVSIKVPHLRNQHEKVGMELTRSDSRAGFGYLHDGSVGSIVDFLSSRLFAVRSDQELADLVALMLAFPGSDFSMPNPRLGNAPPLSKDAHAAVGAQVTLSGSELDARASQFLQLARAGRVDLVVHGGNLGYAFDRATDRFLPSDDEAALTLAQLQSLASPAQAMTWSLVPAGLGRRLGIDRDGDGLGDAFERRQGSNPADASSQSLNPSVGLWFNPERSGHGFDMQRAADFLLVTWYTYDDEGSSTWYQASAPMANPWQAELNRFTWNPATGFVDIEAVGQLNIQFQHARAADLQWQLGTRSGSESLQSLIGADFGLAAPERTGAWFHGAEPGWGLSVYGEGDVRFAVAYFYDADLQPRWVLGQGSNAAEEVLTMSSFQGFCPDCPAVPVVATPTGSIDWQFSGDRSAVLRLDVHHLGQADARWQRGPVSIEPLSDRARRPERH